MVTEPTDARRQCPNGGPDPGWSCRFCRRPIHNHANACGCSQRRSLTAYASICNTCVVALDQLSDTTTPLGRVHQDLVRSAFYAGSPSSDDA